MVNHDYQSALDQLVEEFNEKMDSGWETKSVKYDVSDMKQSIEERKKCNEYIENMQRVVEAFNMLPCKSPYDVCKSLHVAIEHHNFIYGIPKCEIQRYMVDFSLLSKYALHRKRTDEANIIYDYLLHNDGIRVARFYAEVKRWYQGTTSLYGEKSIRISFDDGDTRVYEKPEFFSYYKNGLLCLLQYN